MADRQSTSAPVFFQPLPEHDNLNTAYFLARFAERVRATEVGCWEWIGPKVGAGYGRVSFGGRHRIAHRLIYNLCIGTVANKAIEVCHNCPGGDNPACCNPAHLWLGTHTDNMADASAKGRIKTPGLKGEKHPSAKLTDDLVRELRRRRAAGEGVCSLAAEFGLSPAAVSEAASGKKWGHVK
jgi:hypothetical protein